MNLFVCTYVHMARKKRTILGSKAPPRQHQIWSPHQKCIRDLPHDGEVQYGETQEAYFSAGGSVAQFMPFSQPGREPMILTLSPTLRPNAKGKPPDLLHLFGACLCNSDPISGQNLTPWDWAVLGDFGCNATKVCTLNQHPPSLG